MALFDLISTLLSPLPDALARPGTGVPSGPSQVDGAAAAPDSAQFAALLQALGETRESGQPGAAVLKSTQFAALQQALGQLGTAGESGKAGQPGATDPELRPAPPRPAAVPPALDAEEAGTAAVAAESAQATPDARPADSPEPAARKDAAAAAAAAAPASAIEPATLPTPEAGEAGEAVDRVRPRHAADTGTANDARITPRPSTGGEAMSLHGQRASAAAEPSLSPQAATASALPGAETARIDPIIASGQRSSASQQPALAQARSGNRGAVSDTATMLPQQARIAGDPGTNLAQAGERPQPRTLAAARIAPAPGDAPDGTASPPSPPARMTAQADIAAGRSGDTPAEQSVKLAAGDPAGHIGIHARARGGPAGLAGRTPSRGTPAGHADSANASSQTAPTLAQERAFPLPARAEGAPQPQLQLPTAGGSLPPAGGQSHAAAPGTAAHAAGNGFELPLPAGGAGDAGTTLGQPQAQGAAPAPAGSASSSAAPPQPPQTPQPPASPAMQVGLSIGKLAAEGSRRFTLRLDPPELGRVEVRLEVAQDGHLRAQIRADSRETLDLLQRDSRMLERALGDAGLKTDSGSLNFSLNQQGQNASGFGQNRDGTADIPGSRPGETPGDGADTPEEPDPDNEIRFTAADPDSVDIRV